MSRIAAVEPGRADGKAKALLDGVRAKLGRAPNLMKVLAQAPAALEGYLALSGALAAGALTPVLREQVALLVAEENGCDYCLAAHTALGRMAGLAEPELLASRRGEASDPRARAALGFTRVVLAARGGVSADDLCRARAAGLSDGEIVELVAHVALNVLTNYVNRVAATDVDFPRAAPARPRAA